MYYIIHSVLFLRHRKKKRSKKFIWIFDWKSEETVVRLLCSTLQKLSLTHSARVIAPVKLGESLFYFIQSPGTPSPWHYSSLPRPVRAMPCLRQRIRGSSSEMISLQRQRPLKEYRICMFAIALFCLRWSIILRLRFIPLHYRHWIFPPHFDSFSFSGICFFGEMD